MEKEFITVYFVESTYQSSIDRLNTALREDHNIIGIYSGSTEGSQLIEFYKSDGPAIAIWLTKKSPFRSMVHRIVLGADLGEGKNHIKGEPVESSVTDLKETANNFVKSIVSRYKEIEWTHKTYPNGECMEGKYKTLAINIAKNFPGYMSIQLTEKEDRLADFYYVYENTNEDIEKLFKLAKKEYVSFSMLRITQILS
jgi:hypothetical protein